MFHSSNELAVDSLSSSVCLGTSDPQRFSPHIRAIELAGPVVERSVTTPLYVGHNASRGSMGVAILVFATLHQGCFRCGGEFQDAH
jgi:hypothetical protein